MVSLVGLALGLTLLASLAGVVIEYRESWTFSSTYIAGLAGLSVLARAASTVLKAQAFTLDATGNPYVAYTAGWFNGVSHLANYLAIAFSLAALGLHLRGRVAPSGVLCLAIAAFAALSDALSGTGLLSKSRILLFLALLAASCLRAKGAALGAAVFGLAIAGISALEVPLNPRFATAPCGHDKCGVVGKLVYGVLGNENALGLTIVLSLPFIFLALRPGWLRRISMASVTGVVIISGSRTALVAAGVTLAACWLHANAMHRTARALVIVVSVCGGALGLLTSNPTAYTSRGALWILARSLIGTGHLLVGRGGTFWTTLGNDGEIPQVATYSVHNQWLDVVFDAGLVGVVLFAVVTGLMLRHRHGILILATVMTIGLTERAWGFSGYDTFSWSLVAALAIAGSASSVVRPASESSNGQGSPSSSTHGTREVSVTPR